MNKEKLTVCGTDCTACGCYGSMCQGCNALEGRAFHMAEGSICPIYECARVKKGMCNCGACSDVPCSIWRSFRDPQFTDEQFEANINERVSALRNAQ
ncbi:MAG: hypothetical protein E7559_03355 [Ruminococcaceae bacterium]|nr:hypothetical protein [Oscillospiraceae bacterium]